MQLKGNIKDDPRCYTFCAHLSSFETDANVFTKQLAPFIDNPMQFCSKLSEVTGGMIKDNSKYEDNDEPGPTTRTKKRSSEDPPKIKSKKTKQAEVENQRKDEVEQEIANNEIGTSIISVKISTPKFELYSQLNTSFLNTTYTLLHFNVLIGVFSVPVTALVDPPTFLRVREVRDWYVDYLVGMLLQDKGDHEDLTAPLLVIASVTKVVLQPYRRV